MSAIESDFSQPCPVCGRSLKVSVRLLGRTAACQHCRATFVARDTSRESVPMRDPRDLLVDRANALLTVVNALSQCE